VNDHEPSPAATTVPSTTAPEPLSADTVTVDPASAVPTKVGDVTFVMLSPGTPESLPKSGTRASMISDIG
jgi:hypothetical protein